MKTIQKSDLVAWALICGTVCGLVFAPAAIAQQSTTPIMNQDSTLNNLVHAKGYQTCEIGSLGRVDKVGTGDRDMILVAGAGFGGEIFNEFMERRAREFTMYAITLPGSAGTPAPPMPATGTSYSEATWTHGVVDGLVQLIEDEQLDRPVILAHWYFATQVGLRLALDHPDKISELIVVSGIARYTSANPETFPGPETLSERKDYIDKFMMPRWFKTVTYDTWHENNFRPADYAVHPVRQLKLWRQAAEPPLPVWIRYLGEVWATDITAEMDRLTLPTLIVKPEFDGCYDEELGSYLIAACQTSWGEVESRNNLVFATTINDTRIFIMDDQADELDRIINEFLAGRTDNL